MKIVNALSLLLACSVACSGTVYGQESTEYTVIGTETQNDANSTDSAKHWQREIHEHGDSFSLYVDEMYGKYVEGAVEVTKAEAGTVTSNGTASEATGTDISSWVDTSDLSAVTFSLSDAVSYRTKGASKAIPGFDVIDYGQEDYVFGSESKDARHWDTYVLKVLQEHAEELSGLFNNSEN